ncbi:MAG: hypothetical protein KDK01_13770 [Rhodobacteraceae bacterium]|nr:hypothetical protein [Paracoccaceae bacterium]
MLRCLALFLSLLIAPLGADACEPQFRAGMVAFAAADRALRAAEETLYSGLGWASRGRVLERLEARSGLTTACDEVAVLRHDMLAASRQLDHARTQFGLARALCMGENQRRAAANLVALADTGMAIATQTEFLNDLAARCRSP